MNITYMAGYFTPEKSADTHLNDDLVRDFAEYGAKVRVIVPFPSRGIDEDQVNKYEQLRIEKVSDNLLIHRVGKITRFQKGLVSRGWAFLKKTLDLYNVSKDYDTDCFVIVSTPPFLGYLGMKLSKKAPVVYKLQDVFPDNLIEIRGWSEKNIIVKGLRMLEKGVYSSASKIIVCSQNVKSTLLERGVPADKVIVIHDWVDEYSCVPVDKSNNTLFDEFQIPRNKFTFTYAGNIGHMQNIDTLLDAAKILQSKGLNAQVLIVGDGAQKEKIENRVLSENISNVICVPMQPLDKISMVYSSGDVGLVSLKPGVSKTALPSKTWSIMSAGRPVICEIDTDSELVSILQDNNLGLCVAPNEAERMAEAMEKMYSMDQEELGNIGSSCRAYIINCLNRKDCTHTFFGEIEKITQRRK